ncbi:hypothetical protein VT03_32105 [Planctomyces sp. SH-PL14]|nr:hypothetical protein VT03_32105 [Planctomyces sp. SH-PL14]
MEQGVLFRARNAATSCFAVRRGRTGREGGPPDNGTANRSAASVFRNPRFCQRRLPLPRRKRHRLLVNGFQGDTAK